MNETPQQPANFLTFDADWCPDEAIMEVLDILEEMGGYRAVFFLTNRLGLAAMERLTSNVNYQVGIHPNFLAGGDLEKAHDRITAMLEDIPEATACRTHGLVWWYNLSAILARSGILYDSSVILPFCPCNALWELNGIVQFPIFVGDSFYMSAGHPLEDFIARIQTSGICRVFNFHPIHIYANTTEPGDWLEIKKALNDPDQLSTMVALRKKRVTSGITTVFRSLLAHLSPETCHTFEQVAQLENVPIAGR